jgi:hypothetical protein
MSRSIVLLVVLAAAQLCFGQEARTTIRVGDAFADQSNSFERKLFDCVWKATKRSKVCAG